MISIRPEHLTLAQLLEGRLFKIPEYQRSYSWTNRQRADLFEDIENVHTKGNSHFMATIVGLHRREVELDTNILHELDVVDGQQRLTTLIVLLNAIRLNLADSKKKKDKRLAREIRHLLVKPGGELLLLQTNHDASQHFATFLRDGVAASPQHAITIADRELLGAIADCKVFVSTWTSKGRKLRELVALLKNELSFVLYAISEEQEVYTVFEVLNSRGIAVSWLDRLKSILMGASFEVDDGEPTRLIDELHTVWREIYGTIGLRQGLSTEALRFAATLLEDHGNKPLGEQDAVDLLRTWTDSAENIRSSASWLLQVTKSCHKVVSNDRLNAVTRIAQARLLAVAIELMDGVNEAQKADLLSCWEKVSFRIYGMSGYDARSGVGHYVRLARAAVKGSTAWDRVRNGILKIGEEYPIESAIEAMRNANCYDGWQDELRYVMFRYEEHLATQQGNNFRSEQWTRIWHESPSKSIEHIWAQSTAPDDVVHNIGNLMILPPNLNSKLRDKPFREKKAAYRETGLLVAQEVAAESRWTRKAIRRREERILEWAHSEWGTN